MRKEVLFAIVIGIFLGGVILYGIHLANQATSVTITPDNSKSTITPTPTLGTTKKELTIISPQNHSVTSEKTLDLIGNGNPQSILAITSEVDDLITETSPEGTFSARLNLIDGQNTITISELQTDQSTKSTTITIIQSDNLPE